MGFLDQLSSNLLSSINNEIGMDNHGPGTLDTNGNSLGALGSFASRIDASAQRSYVENGTHRDFTPRNLEILMQEPDITVVIKKKMFSSLSENFRYDLMNVDEKLFIKASKRLFYNKCRLIAAYERLTKFEKVTNSGGILNDQIFPALFASIDVINSLSPGLIGSKTQSILDKIRKFKTLSEPNQVTTWIINQTPYLTDTGEGNGVFELTLVNSIDVTNSVNLGGGSASLNIEDPYKLMIISNEDIEQAIADVTGIFSQNNFFKLTISELQDTINRQQKDLNQLRLSRNVPRINFLINDQSLLFKKVRAILDEEGTEIIFNYNGGLAGIDSSVELDSSAVADTKGLQGQEISFFQEIIQNIFSLLGLQHTTKTQNKKFNQETNYVRRKMKLFFSGKPIVQHLDTIHIFASSKTLLDQKISQNLNASFSSENLVNQLNTVVGNLDEAVNNILNSFSGNHQTFIEEEKNAIVGQDFPMWLWLIMRNDFTRQQAGISIFNGVVTDSPYSFDNGKYTLRISASDNSYYFKIGQININPSLEVFNSDLYDPLTPFKLEFDAASGFIREDFPPLLDENIKLLTSGCVKAKTGRFRGQNLNEQLYKIQDADQIASKFFRKKLNDPDGFVYRFKEGIGSLTLFGEPHASGTFVSETSPSLTADPFAGQDVMNVLSLLVTGKPYNFNNFLRGALSVGNFSRDELLNENTSSSFFKGLIGDLIKQNQLWGNFIPFKKMIINESGYNFLRTGEFDLTTTNRRISELLKERAQRFDELTTLVPEFANNPQFYKTGLGGSSIFDAADARSIDISSLSKLGEDIIRLDFEIQKSQNDFNRHLQDTNLRQTDGTLKIFGDDISFDSSIVNTGISENQKSKNREDFRKKINRLTQRRFWQVKANEDQNLFIVDDSYDKNYDIQGFETALSNGLQLFKSTYTNVFEKINGVAQILGLEIFADSQGHIQARPPQYNRIPSSVFYQIMQTKDRTGIQIFPEYLEKLFLNQIQGLTQRLEIVEDEIRIRAAVLGATDDGSASLLLNGSTLSKIENRNFSFVTTSDGFFGGKDLRVLLSQANPDLSEASVRKTLDTLNNEIANIFKSNVNFDIIKRTSIINSSQQLSSISNNENQINETINIIGKRLEFKTGNPAPTKASLLGNDRSLRGAGKSQLDVFNVTEQISQFISERQGLIKLLSNALKNLDQGLILNQDPEIGNDFLYPNLNTPNKHLPSIIEHMIEDENYDDFGYNSGKRYIIHDHQIINWTVNEKAPDWTVIEVDGQLAQGLVDGPNSLQIGDGGNAISSAFAVDYDMWRMYGFRAPHTVQVPFLSDPESQCAPYAVFLLNKARKDIFQASITVAGNEAMQPGEVYYIKDLDLLFYAETVSHSFSFGGQFTTTLNMKYGHNPGEYIPTMLDIIGKGLYTNRFQSNLVKHVRHGNPNGDVHLTALVVENSTGNFAGAAIASLLDGRYGDENRKNLSNVMLSASGLLAGISNTTKLKLQIRIYFNSNLNLSVNNDLKNIALSIKEWVVNPSKSTYNLEGKIILPEDNSNIIDPEQIEIAEIDLSDPLTTSSPSSQAWDLARTVANLTGNHNDFINSSDVQVLFNKIIDIWASFNSVEKNILESPTEVKDQKSLEELENYIKNFKQSLVQ